MYTAVTLTPDQEQYFEALEDRIERPIRLLYGSGRTVSPTSTEPWSDLHVEGTTHTVADGNASGITFIVFATMGVRNSFADWRFPTTDEHQDAGGDTFQHIYDCLVVSNDTINGLVVNVPEARQRRARDDEGNLVWPERPFMEVQERFIAFQIPVIGNYRGCAFQQYVDEAVEISLDHERFVNLAQELFDRNVDAFQQYMEENRGNPIDNVRQTIESLTQRITEAERSQAQWRQQLRPLQAQIDAMIRAQDEGGDNRTTMAMQLRRLNDDDRIESITFSGSQVLLVTNHMNLMHPNTREDVYLGKFRFMLEPSSGYVTIHNLTNTRGGRAHPHVGTGGDPCFGQMGDSIMEYMMRGDIEASIEMIFSFLASVNLNDDWGRMARWWFMENPLPPRRYDGSIIGQEVPA